MQQATDTEKDIKKIIILAVVVLVLLIFVILVLFFDLFSNNETEMQDGPILETEELIVPLSVGNESVGTPFIPQEELSVSEPIRLDQSETRVWEPIELPPKQTQNDIIASLFAEMEEVKTSIQPPQPPTRSENTTRSVVRQSVQREPLKRTSFADCGSVSVPESMFAQISMLNTIHEEPAVLCLGEAVGRNCRASEVEVTSESLGSGTVTVVKDNNGECSVGGSQVGSGFITLCTIDSILALNEEEKEWDEWESDFREDPQGLMSQVVNNNASLLYDQSTVERLDCNEYEI